MRTWLRISAFDVRFLIRWLVVRLLLAVACAPPAAFAQDAQLAAARVSTFVLAPFVMEHNGKLSGFSIELWNEIAARLHLQSQFQVTPDVKTVFQALRTHDADVAVSGLFYSAERDREFDFSYPIMEAGLRVMVRDTGQSTSTNP